MSTQLRFQRAESMHKKENCYANSESPVFAAKGKPIHRRKASLQTRLSRQVSTGGTPKQGTQGRQTDFMSVSTARNLRNQIAGFELPKFMEMPVLSPPQDVLEAQVLSEVALQQIQNARKEQVAATEPATPQRMSSCTRAPCASPQIVTTATTTTTREQRPSSLHPARPSLPLAVVQACPSLVPAQMESIRGSFRAPCASPMQRHRNSCPTPVQCLSGGVTVCPSPLPVYRDAMPGAVTCTPSASPSCTPMSVCREQRPGFSGMSGTSSISLTDPFCLGSGMNVFAAPEAWGMQLQTSQEASQSFLPPTIAANLAAMGNCSRTSFGRGRGGKFSSAPLPAGPCRSPAAACRTVPDSANPACQNAALRSRTSSGCSSDVPTSMAYSAIERAVAKAIAGPPVDGLATTCPSVSVTVGPSGSSSMASGLTASSYARAQSPAMVSRKVRSNSEHFPNASFMPMPRATSPVAGWRQIPEQQVQFGSCPAPKLTKCKSLDIQVGPCPRLTHRCDNQNIPASLGVESAPCAQWGRSRSPTISRGPEAAPGFGYAAPGPRRNSWSSMPTVPKAEPPCMTSSAPSPASVGRLSEPPCMTSSVPKNQTATAARGAFVEDLSFSGLPFDPTVPALKALIFEKLAAASNSTMVQMRQDGGMNDGMWLITSGSGSLIVKLVPHERRHAQMATEAEQYQKLVASHPSMIDDPALAFPIKIFHCREQNSQKTSFDLIVMRKAAGKCFSEVIARRWFMNQKAELWKELYAIGSFLADVHARLNNMQHGDFTPSNVFYDEAAGTFTMVDLSDFGPQEYRNTETDVERFCSGLQMVSKCFGDQFYTEGKRTFEAGYNDRRAGKARSMTYP